MRPARVAFCVTLPDLTGPDPKHDGIGIEWFGGADHLSRFQRWLETADGQLVARQADAVVDRDASPVIVADECVLRGAGWLERRWQDGGEKLKHMAIALRAGGLTPAESAHSYLAIYEIEADDLAGPMQELAARSAAGRMRHSDALQTDPPPVVTIYELIE